MKRCSITYAPIPNNENYSKQGLKTLSPALKDLEPLELSNSELRTEAIARAGKMSLQGVQTKLSAKLKIKEEHFEVVDQYGNYILKIQSDSYPELPENEALTMSLAKMIGLEVPVHGLVASKDNQMIYFIKRFDREGHNKKVATEDFAQLLQLSRDTKYNSSMEKIQAAINTYCSFPKIEMIKLLKITLFSFLIGNEDMHLKNFSLITRKNITTLSPVYDLLNSTIVLDNAKEELALPLNGKKNNLTRKDLINYFAMDRLGLNQKIIDTVLTEITSIIPQWKKLITESFLSKSMQKRYLVLLKERCERLKIL